MKKRSRRKIALVISAELFVLAAILTLGFWLIRKPLKPSVNMNFKADTERSVSVLSDFAEIESEKTEESEATEENEEPTSVEIVMVGDVLLHQRVLDSGQAEGGSYNFDHLFKNTASKITMADLAIVNQETVLGGEELRISEYPSFNSPQEIGDAEVGAGFDVILGATNHALDRNANGILKTTAFWKENYPDIALIGMYDSQEASDEIYVYEKDDISIAVLNYTFGTNGVSKPSSMPYCVNYLDEDQVVDDIARAHELADFVVVCPHWGTEYRLTQDSYQEKWTDIFLDNHVDLVIGAHPHVIEPVEMVTGEDGHQMLVYYSLGNYVCGTSSSGEGIGARMVGGMADVTIGYDEDGNLKITDYGVIPLVTHEAEGSGYTVYYLKDYTEELAEENWIVKQDPGFSLDYCQDLVDQVWGDLAE